MRFLIRFFQFADFITRKIIIDHFQNLCSLTLYNYAELTVVIIAFLEYPFLMQKAVKNGEK